MSSPQSACLDSWSHLLAFFPLPQHPIDAFLTALLFLDNCPQISFPISNCFQLKSHHLRLNYFRSLNRPLSFSLLPIDLVHGCFTLTLRVDFLRFSPARMAHNTSLLHQAGVTFYICHYICSALGSACGISQDIISLFSVEATSTPVSTGLLMPSAPRSSPAFCSSYAHPNPTSGPIPNTTSSLESCPPTPSPLSFLVYHQAEHWL